MLIQFIVQAIDRTKPAQHGLAAIASSLHQLQPSLHLAHGDPPYSGCVLEEELGVPLFERLGLAILLT
ncbi:hypothetical protein DFAR_860007 [Desulfarculales bacterium]